MDCSPHSGKIGMIPSVLSVIVSLFSLRSPIKIIGISFSQLSRRRQGPSLEVSDAEGVDQYQLREGPALCEKRELNNEINILNKSIAVNKEEVRK